MYFSPILPNVGLPYEFGGFFQFWPPRPQFPSLPTFSSSQLHKIWGSPFPESSTPKFGISPPKSSKLGSPLPKNPRIWGAPLTTVRARGVGGAPSPLVFCFFPVFPLPILRFRSKYHPDEAGKRQQEAQAALRNRLSVFLYLWEHGWFDNLLLDIDRAPQIIKTLDAGTPKNSRYPKNPPGTAQGRPGNAQGNIHKLFLVPTETTPK